MRNYIKLILALMFIGCSSPNDKLYFKNEYHELVEFQGEKINLTLIPLYNGGYEIHNFKDDLLCDSIGRYKSFKADSDFFKFMASKHYERIGWKLNSDVQMTYRFSK